jgi:hypothetical protein
MHQKPYVWVIIIPHKMNAVSGQHLRIISDSNNILAPLCSPKEMVFYFPVSVNFRDATF